MLGQKSHEVLHELARDVLVAAWNPNLPKRHTRKEGRTSSHQQR